MSQEVSTRVSLPVQKLSNADLKPQIKAMIETHGKTLNVTQAAQELGISRAKWYRLVKEINQ
jgi:hypothetical protein